MEATKPPVDFLPHVFAVLVTSVLFLISWRMSVKRHTNEPPYVDSKVPLIGHVIGLLQRRYCYYVDLLLVPRPSYGVRLLTDSRCSSRETQFPIYALNFPGMPGGRVYVISSPALAVQVQRDPSKISFWHVEALFTGRLVGLSPFAAKTLARNIDGNEDEPSYLKEGMKNAHAAMRPGGNLIQTTRAALEVLGPLVGSLGESDITQIELGQWVSEVLMTSITGGIFGPQNPFRNQEVAKGFRIFQENAAGLICLPCPRLTCGRSYIARENVGAAFEKYYSSRGCDSASSWVQGATKISDSYGISDRDKARLDISNSHAVLANTIPAGFWTVYHIFSDARILNEVRSALMPLLTIESENGAVAYTIDVKEVREVPILESVFYEVLRHYANGTGTRIVVEDTMLDDRYLLKKGSFVFMPNRSYHFNPAIWGPTVDDFDAHRFIDLKTPRGAFRPFGGGANLCPGRFFAMNGILAMSAMLALRYDVKPLTGHWLHPGVDDTNMTLLVHPPKAKTELTAVARAGWKDGQWAFKIV